MQMVVNGSGVLAPPKSASARVWFAVFDEAGLLVNFVGTRADMVPEGAVAFDHKPDNRLDAIYRWDANLLRFEPDKNRLLEAGESAAYNQLVVAGLVGATDEETLPAGVKEDIALIRRRSPGTVKALKKKYAGLVPRHVQPIVAKS